MMTYANKNDSDEIHAVLRHDLFHTLIPVPKKTS